MGMILWAPCAQRLRILERLNLKRSIEGNCCSFIKKRTKKKKKKMKERNSGKFDSFWLENQVLLENINLCSDLKMQKKKKCEKFHTCLPHIPTWGYLTISSIAPWPIAPSHQVKFILPCIIQIISLWHCLYFLPRKRKESSHKSDEWFYHLVHFPSFLLDQWVEPL